MKTVTKLLDEIKQRKQIETDYALAKALDLPRGHICDYYKGNRYPNEFACLKIAEALENDYNEISALVRIEAEKDEHRREEWKKYYKSIGGFAASFMLAVLACVIMIVTTPQEAVAKTMTYATPILHATNYALRMLAQKFKRICAEYARNLASACVSPRLAR